MTFQNAKIISENEDPATYRALGLDYRRGDREFIMSRSELMDLAACAHKWKAGIESGDTKSTEWGSLIDCLVLTPDQFFSRYAIAPKTYTSEKGEVKDWNWNANVCKAWRDGQGSRSVLKAENYKLANDSLARLTENSNASELINCSRKSVMLTAEYRDKSTGLVIPLKCLLDLVPDKSHPRFGKCLSDFKTAASANPREFEQAIYKHDYDAQAALYTDIYAAATGEDRCEWIFALQENIEPFEVADPLPALSSEFMEVGRAKYQHALKFYCQCLKDDKWPSYSPGARLNIDGRYFADPAPWMLAAAIEWPRLPDTLPILRPIETQLAEVTP